MILLSVSSSDISEGRVDTIGLVKPQHLINIHKFPLHLKNPVSISLRPQVDDEAKIPDCFWFFPVRGNDVHSQGSAVSG